MKQLVLIFFFVLWGVGTNAQTSRQVPATLNLDLAILNASGVPYANKTFSYIIRIYADSLNNPVYETYSKKGVVTDTFGNASLHPVQLNYISGKAYYYRLYIDTPSQIPTGFFTAGKFMNVISSLFSEESSTQGATGIVGQNANQILLGRGVPSSMLGQDGDYFIDTLANNIYGPKYLTAWFFLANLTGPVGDPGLKGATGRPSSGNILLSGNGIPSLADGISGDFYLDYAQKTLYGPKGTSTWGSESISLLGPIGDSGAVGISGYRCPNHYVGEVFGGGVVGHVFFDSSGVEHGIIVGLADTTFPYFSSTSGGAYSSFVNGKLNTDSLKLLSPVPAQVAYCSQYRVGGFSDWFLPSYLEMNQLLLNSTQINLGLNQLPNSKGLDRTKEYVTSTYNGTFNMIGIQFQNGILLGASTGMLFRPVRMY